MSYRFRKKVQLDFRYSVFSQVEESEIFVLSTITNIKASYDKRQLFVIPKHWGKSATKHGSLAEYKQKGAQ